MAQHIPEMNKEELRDWRMQHKGKPGKGKVEDHISQKEAAELIGVSKHTYIAWENGRTIIPAPIRNLVRFI
jgi:DNA-binding XRE family transcriptional regulator